jgi:splicing factor 3B subunit 2
LQGKRGIEKPPFQLPDFIAATGISKIRQALQEKDAAKKEKAKARERMQPKLGKIDIDYQVLHDAFFKYQTKPKLTIHGDLYYEGKEFEITLREKRPGGLTEDLKRALGMPDGAPPPWLINMQRYGPPPSYPNLKIPGLNAPIPEGARYGYHAGGWGKPPVDEFGRPLYGDVFGTAPSEPPPEISEPIVRQHWGELEQEEEEEVVEEEEQPQEPEEEAPASGFETPSGMTTPSSGMETPETIELRKTAKKEAPAADQEDETGRQLYQVIPQASTAVGTALVGSSHKYIIPSEKREPKAKNAVDMVFMKSQRGEKVDIALNPAEVENLEELSVDILKKKYDAAVNEKQAPKEDVSDIIAEHSKKRKKDSKDKDKSSKKYKDFKF